MTITAKKPKLLAESYEDAQNRDISVGLHIAFQGNKKTEEARYHPQDLLHKTILRRVLLYSMGKYYTDFCYR